MIDDNKIGVVIPSYNVASHIVSVVSSMPSYVDRIYIVDDCCPQNSGKVVKECKTLPRNIKSSIYIIKNKENLGVGGAVKNGFEQALKDKMNIIVKIDGDGQMDPSLIKSFAIPLIEKKANYVKGNRFYNLDDLKEMPLVRIIGNSALAFMAKMSSGYWSLFDPNNGFVAIKNSTLQNIALHKINDRYFFESDMLFRLNIIGAKVYDLPMKSKYANTGKSNLSPLKSIIPFFVFHLKNYFKRVIYNYFLRNFSFASINLILGIILISFSIFYGMHIKNFYIAIGEEVTPVGIVIMIYSALIIGVQFFLSFLNHDMASEPAAYKPYDH